MRFGVCGWVRQQESKKGEAQRTLSWAANSRLDGPTVMVTTERLGVLGLLV